MGHNQTSGAAISGADLRVGAQRCHQGNRNQDSRSCGSCAADLCFGLGVAARGTAAVGAGVAAAIGEGLAITIRLEMYSPASGSGSSGAAVKPKPTPK
jgi:hypothetical protein